MHVAIHTTVQTVLAVVKWQFSH